MCKNEYSPFEDTQNSSCVTDYRTISNSRFEGTWPRPIYCSIDEDWMDDNDDSFFDIANRYLNSRSK